MWPRTKKASSPKIGGNDLELARSALELSPTGMEWNARGFAYSKPDRNAYLWSCEGGDSIPIIRDKCFHIASWYRDDGEPYIASQCLASTESMFRSSLSTA